MSSAQKTKALLIVDSNPIVDPRPSRMIEFLRSKYELTVVARNAVDIDGVESISLFEPHTGADDGNGIKVFRYLRLLWARAVNFTVRAFRLIVQDYEGIVWSSLGAANSLKDELFERQFDLIISHDCTLLPFAFAVKAAHSKVILDAREYYPRNFEDQWLWRLKTQPVNVYLCKKYLAKCDKVITVSDGLACEYEQEFGVVPEVVMSLPSYHDLQPSVVDGKKIRIIHHGAANRSRHLESMLDIMAHLGERYTLDLMLVGDPAYIRMIDSMAKRYSNVRLIPPVPMWQIIPFLNQYDIGLFLCPPSNFNLKYALPNKLFEFVQGRLAVAIGPSVEMKKIVEKYDCGIVAGSFDPKDLAGRLKELTPEKIKYYKQRSGLAAHELSAEVGRVAIERIVRNVLAVK